MLRNESLNLGENKRKEVMGYQDRHALRFLLVSQTQFQVYTKGFLKKTQFNRGG